MTTGETPTILVVDDDEAVADVYASQLSSTYRVLTAYDGEAALEKVTADVDVVLLDRRMHGLSGREVLEAIRDRDLDCGVIMVTAVDPGFDIVDMGFDDYLRKPVDRETLRECVDRLVRRSTYDARVQEYFATARKHALLAEQHDEVAASPEFQALERDLQRLRDRVDDVTRSFDDDDYEVLFRRLSADEGEDDAG